MPPATSFSNAAMAFASSCDSLYDKPSNSNACSRKAGVFSSAAKPWAAAV